MDGEGNGGFEGFDDVRDALVVSGILRDLGVEAMALKGEAVDAHKDTLGKWLELLGYEDKGECEV